jgi:hypothetical protein
MNQYEQIETDMNDFSENQSGPKQVKGGVFAPTDIELIKHALSFYAQNCLVIEDWQSRQLTNLMHRLNNRV